ncbi:MAG: lipocalin-like domain-containing protein [Pseudomonadota bacterium]
MAGGLGFVALLFLFLATPASSQSFAGLGENADGFAIPQPGDRFDFPIDHGPHPDYRIEWWYLTANLTGADGRDYGVQWTLFRSAREPRADDSWRSPQTWMGHAALTTPDAHFAAERFARGGSGQAGVTVTPFTAWIDDWQMAGPEANLDTLTLTARGQAFSYTLDLSAQGPLVLHGDNGHSVKSAEGQASRYYSQPFYTVTGTLMTPKGDVAVTGTAWLDREYSSQPLGRTQSGWDWFAFTFPDGHRLMAFELRDSANAAYRSGSWIAPDGTVTPLGPDSFDAQPLATTDVNGRAVPTRWAFRYPAQGVDLTVEAINPGAWNDLVFAYWEGPIRFSGSHQGTGYLEMTGYE